MFFAFCDFSLDNSDIWDYHGFMIGAACAGQWALEREVVGVPICYQWRARLGNYRSRNGGGVSAAGMRGVLLRSW